ncbi:MAG: endo-1,4-beta-xylanase, partial [Planctomycetaceae bacterium]
MGQFIFDVSDSQADQWARSIWSSAYICGIEGVPWHTTTRLEGNRLIVQRDIDESGKLYLPWPIEGHGPMMQSTCSLRPSTEPYPLLLELARGACYNVRSQSDVWHRSGLRLDESFVRTLDDATAAFIEASGCGGQLALQDEHALRSLTLLHRGAEILSESYAAQAISFRKQNEVKLSTLVGAVIHCDGGEPKHGMDYSSAFNATAIRMSWGDIETDAGRFDYDKVDEVIGWASALGLRVAGGPLLDFHDHMMPHWLYLIEDNFESLLDSVNHYVEQTVKRYRGRVQIWNCASGLNTPGPIDLTDEQVMRLAVTVLQTVRRVDPQTPAIISFDQPFGEYLAFHRNGISPIHFADALARSGLGLAGLGLELRLGYSGYGTLPRSTLQVGQMLDRWATLGMPVLVQLGMAADSASDPLARRPANIICQDEEAGEVAQMRDAGAIIRTLLAKQFVHAIVWEGWDDTVTHLLPHTGLHAA